LDALDRRTVLHSVLRWASAFATACGLFSVSHPVISNAASPTAPIVDTFMSSLLRDDSHPDVNSLPVSLILREAIRKGGFRPWFQGIWNL
jgi:hypothetical protein